MGRKPKEPEAPAHSGGADGESKPRRTRRSPLVVSEQAAEYGIDLPEALSANERFLSPNDIGKILNVTGEAVKQWIYRRKLPAVKLANGYWKVRVRDFEAFLKARHDVGKRQVLVTEIEGNDSSEVVKAIEELGHHAIIAHNYSDALLKAMDHYPAMFIITLSPTAKESWRFAQKVRGTKQLRSFPILIIASQDFTDAETDRALELGAQSLLTMPTDYARLKSEIERILLRSM